MGASQLSEITINSSIRKYDVYFSISFIDSLKKTLLPDDVLIIDRRVFSHLNENVQNVITTHHHKFIDATENQKSYLELSSIIEELIENRFRKTNRLIAIGGGITQDITAFIASIMYRGVEWLFFPTTLLAQADSCIGGKTSINIGKYKNQLGNFYPPKKIFIIPEVLKSLPKLDFKSGMGEMLHFYLVSSSKDFEYYLNNYEMAFTDEDILLAFIKRNLEIKRTYIEQDEFDRNVRQLLNYGHSFGHAIESLSEYSVPHGIAVSYGMDMANFISMKLGFIGPSERLKVRKQLEKIWEGTTIKNISVEKYEVALSRDKKNIGNTYQLILTKGIGNMIKYGIEPSLQFSKWLNEYFETQFVTK
jgi:3-dehydroquinate synthase